MATLKILDQTYTLPTTATEGFRRLQEQIQLRQRLIQQGVRPKSRRWRLPPRRPAQLIGQLENHRRAYALQQRIEHVTRDVADMAEVALHFEEYIRNHFGPLQTLLEQVSRVDTTLHSAVAEIEAITQQMLQQESVA